mmetsp:Transcript_11412/g.28840  ORF Transcript_11412/g.28840 Transcript_11412/m.28840 type:complete len:303 (-) Transcript_11412:1075-1983(-)
MTSYHPSSSIELFRLGELGKNVADHGHSAPITADSSFDLETVLSYPKIATNGSMNSFSTQWSTVTAQVSNTTKQHSENKRRKRKFLHFVKILMRIVKEKDEGKFRNAKAVVCNWKGQKHEGGIENFSESLSCNLKQAVGPQYWSEAREHLSQASAHIKTKRLSFDTTTEPYTQSSDITTPLQYEEEYCSPSHTTQMSTRKTYRNDNLTTDEMKEMRMQKKRQWMVIRVFLKRLQEKDQHLYRKAHVIVNDCMRQHRQGRQSEDRNRLSGSIETCLKKQFGSELWMRAEHIVSEAFVVRHEDQ